MTMTEAARKRQVISHKDHDHPSTSKARAECRAAMAEAAEKAKKPAAKKTTARKAAPKPETTDA